jgi:hypothetical protein
MCVIIVYTAASRCIRRYTHDLGRTAPCPLRGLYSSAPRGAHRLANYGWPWLGGGDCLRIDLAGSDHLVWLITTAVSDSTSGRYTPGPGSPGPAEAGLCHRISSPARWTRASAAMVEAFAECLVGTGRLLSQASDLPWPSSWPPAGPSARGWRPSSVRPSGGQAH